MNHSVFWDTSGFYSLLSSDDSQHKNCVNIITNLSRKRVLSVTSDWVVGETCTLLTVRKKRHLANQFLEVLCVSKALDIVNISQELFEQSRKIFIQRKDKAYSFTDCTSFSLMRSRNLTKVVTSDSHFVSEGFEVML